MRPLIAATAVVALLGGCAADRDANARHQIAAVETPESARETFALGSMLTPAGAVPQEAASEAFSRGGEVFLSVDVASASSDQTIDVEWLDAHGRVDRKESRNVPEGTHYAAWPGAHRAVIVINGRRVMEKPFSIL